MNRIKADRKTVAAAVLAVVVVAAALLVWKLSQFRDLAQKGAEAYVFALPLVLMDVTREETFKHPAASDAEPNRIYMIPVLADHTFRTVVRPNVDTLYSIAWIDLGAEPMLLTIPPSDGRYHVEQFMDAWTNVFFAPGIRTLGNEAGRFLIAPPGWQGEVPDGFTRVDAPTDMVWLLARVFVNGNDDLDAARRYLASVDLRPLSRIGDGKILPVLPDERGRGAKRSDPIDIVRRMDSGEFFARYMDLVKNNPPAAADQPFVDAVLEPLGLTPERYAGWQTLPIATRKAIAAGIDEVWSVLTSRAEIERERTPTGWAGLGMSKQIGVYHTNYALRAGVAVFGLGANIPQDAIYLNASVDGQGQPLRGGSAYTLTFAAHQLPPVKGFWSVTMYDHKGYLLDSPLGRYNLRQSDPLRYNADGSLTLLIQPDEPADASLRANWLPSPRDGEFVLSMRLYWPEQTLLDGEWMPPALLRERPALATNGG